MLRFPGLKTEPCFSGRGPSSHKRDGSEPPRSQKASAHPKFRGKRGCLRMREFPEEILKFCFCAGGKGLRSLAPAPTRIGAALSLLRSPIATGLGLGQSLRCWLPAFLGPDQTPEGWVLRTHTHGKQLVAEGEMDCLFLCTALSADPRLPWRNPWLILTLEAPLYHQLSDPCPLSPARRPAFMLCPLHGMPPSLCTPADGPVLLCPPFPSRPSPL